MMAATTKISSRKTTTLAMMTTLREDCFEGEEKRAEFPPVPVGDIFSVETSGRVVELLLKVIRHVDGHRFLCVGAENDGGHSEKQNQKTTTLAMMTTLRREEDVLKERKSGQNYRRFGDIFSVEASGRVVELLLKVLRHVDGHRFLGLFSVVVCHQVVHDQRDG
ncbi:hypothetical protein TYRP_001589, partial [Tyrophagus putrescentiae]